MPQRTVLGLALFNISISDVPRNVTNKLGLYADHSKLIGAVDAKQGVASIQSHLDIFANEPILDSSLWRLESNLENCNVLHFWGNNPQQQCSMSSNADKRKPISKNTLNRGLGVIVDKYLKFNYHTQAAVAEANQTFNIIKRTITSRSPAIVTKLFKCLVRSRLEFWMCITTLTNKTDQMALKVSKGRRQKA